MFNTNKGHKQTGADTMDGFTINLAPLEYWTDKELHEARFDYFEMLLQHPEYKPFIYDCYRPIKKELARRKIEKKWS